MKRYYNQTGKHQKKLDTLVKQVPRTGMADTLHIEAVRLLSNALYDFYNNAGCNEKIDDLNFVYDWLDKYHIEYDRLSDIDHAKLYREFRRDTIYVMRMGEKLEALADKVILQAYKVEKTK